MSKSSINEWDASDASDDDDGLKTPKTPSSQRSRSTGCSDNLYETICIETHKKRRTS